MWCSHLSVMFAGSDVIEQLSSRRRQIHSVAVLAHASADVATPLLLSATLKVIFVSWCLHIISLCYELYLVHAQGFLHQSCVKSFCLWICFLCCAHWYAQSALLHV